MTIPAHGFMQALLVYAPLRAAGVPGPIAVVPAAIAGLYGVLHDTSALLETKDGVYSGLYARAHDHKTWPWKWGLKVGTWLAIEIDKRVHFQVYPFGPIWPKYLFWEICTWAALAVTIAMEIKS